MRPKNDYSITEDALFRGTQSRNVQEGSLVIVNDVRLALQKMRWNLGQQISISQLADRFEFAVAGCLLTDMVDSYLSPKLDEYCKSDSNLYSDSDSPSPSI